MTLRQRIIDYLSKDYDEKTVKGIVDDYFENFNFESDIEYYHLNTSLSEKFKRFKTWFEG